MTEVGCELGNEVQVPHLSWRVPVCTGRESIGQWFVVGEDVKFTTLKEVTKMFEREIDSQEFTVKRAVTGLSRFQSLRKERDRTPLTIAVLLQYSTNCYI